jgi:ATP-dependent RNA helicase SUPV3L1/SUV3
MAAQDPGASAAMRSVLAMLVDEGGVISRGEVAKALSALEREQRRSISRLGVRIGALDMFMPDVLKPEAMRWRTALRAAASGAPMPELPPHSSVVLETPSDERRLLLARLGFRPLGPQMLRVDMVERLARHAHEARAGKQETVLDQPLATSLGLQPPSIARLMKELGFRPVEGDAGWIWRGRGRPQPERKHDPRHAFAALAELRRG